ncbi:MAG: hypothetical protein ACI92S_000999, partial [Planctomycetaceae bacterium]
KNDSRRLSPAGETVTLFNYSADISDRSGVGVQITVKDVNRDDRPDGFEARHVRVSESPKTIVVSECSTGDKN